MFDASVSGNVTGAEAASITFMVGGVKEDFEALEAYLKIVGNRLSLAEKLAWGKLPKSVTFRSRNHDD